MAIKPDSLFTGKIAAASTDYPLGSARNVTTPGDGTGTPFVADLLNDTFGFQQAILSEAGITPSQSPDTAVDSQYLSGLTALLAVESFDTFSALEASTRTLTGSEFVCRERANATYILQAPGYTALTGDATFANSRVAALQISGDLKTKQYGVTPTSDFAADLSNYEKTILAENDTSFEFDTVLVSPQVNLKGDRYTLAHTTNNAGRSAVTPYFEVDTSLTLEGANLEGNVLTGGRRLVIAENSGVSDISLENVSCDFKSVVDPADGLATDQPGNALFRFNDSNDDVTNISINNSNFKNAFWGFLKGNSVVSTEKNISVTNSTFDEFSSVALLFNSPADGSLIENVSVLNVNLGANNSRQKFGEGTGYPHRGTFAGNVQYAKLIACHAYGDGSELFRSEEAATNVIMALNTAKLNGNDGIEIIPNDANGGVVHVPSKFYVGGNILHHTGATSAPDAGWGIGLYTYESNVGYSESAHDSIVSNNIIDGFDQGLFLHSGMQRNIAQANILIDCTVGIETNSPSLGMKDNQLTDCATSVKFNAGGMIGGISQRSKSIVPDEITVSPASGAGILSKWDWETGLFDRDDSGIIEYAIAQMGDRMHGTLKIVLTRLAFYSVVMGTVDYDGSTLTFTETFRTGNGSPAISNTALSLSSGKLNIRVFEDTEDRTGCKLQVEFDGVHVFFN
jgi:hypothetical protein